MAVNLFIASQAQPLTSADLLRPLTGPGRINRVPYPPQRLIDIPGLTHNVLGRPLPPARAKTTSATSVTKLQNQNASLQSTNNQLKKETAKVKGALSDVHRNLTQAQKGFAALQKDLLNTKKELLKAKAANEELAQALESNLRTAKPRSVKSPSLGSFSSKGVRSDTVPIEKTSKQVSFPEEYPALPSIAVGLYSIDVPNGDSMRATCFISNLDNKSFEVNINGDPNTGVNSGGCVWLEIEPDHQDFQCGRFNTRENGPWSTPQALNQQRIFFQRPYSGPPEIIVWLTAFDMNPEKNWRVRTYASDITTTGFTIHIDTWGDSELYYGSASWVAYPSGRPDTCSGNFSTLDIRPYTDPRAETSGPVEFPKNTFTDTPSVALGINTIDVDCTKGMRLEATNADASADGMTWCLNSWKDTILYSAGGTYIAFV